MNGSGTNSKDDIVYAVVEKASFLLVNCSELWKRTVQNIFRLPVRYIPVDTKENDEGEGA
ncbi:hypothetical protein J6TS2_27050 [Heyndrickxia sporothermodurans]|nr:hypothetical protein J6TS2_27050 [Heyndrickxia sporothermodurans]